MHIACQQGLRFQDTLGTMAEPSSSNPSSARPGRHWLWRGMAAAVTALLAACGSTPPSTPSGAGASSPAAVREYRQDAARHIYARNQHRIYQGKLPPMLYAIGVLEVELDRNGGVPPYSETQRYVQRVGQLADRYRIALATH